ncbi:hypothetical protein MLD38_003124 [Melastoma candidum]|uniref:Uncharacterized protein n=1 Tax=Melastoma candidum TaxID=119954 RepID=A0ACB9S351_9MYRT|nr:hypothetical protein MLD38_003124 [Melastoma candidum]
MVVVACCGCNMNQALRSSWSIFEEGVSSNGWQCEDGRGNTLKLAYGESKGLDFSSLMEDIKNAPNESFFLLHACAHNPTGVDPAEEQWREISQPIKGHFRIPLDYFIANGHFPFFDMAYQGFASGDPERDTKSIRILLEDGHAIGIAQSYAKNMGLYGQRVGCLRRETGCRSEKPIAATCETYVQQYTATYNLEKLGSTLSWKHITNQIGMFCYSGMTPEQVDRLTKEFHIYITCNCRISMAGVTTGIIGYLANAIHEVTKSS